MTTTPEGKKPPPFFCPRCGQKHRADLSELSGRDGAVMKAMCRGCGIDLAITLGADGLPICDALSDVIGEIPGGAAVSASITTTPAPGTIPSPEAGPEDTPAPLPASDKTEGTKPAAPTPRKGRASKPAAPARSRSRGASRRKAASPPPPDASKSESPRTMEEDLVQTSEAPPEPPASAEPTPEVERKINVTSESEFAEGEHVDRYLIEDLIGEGGTGMVYRAFDPTTNRTVGLKLLKPDQSEAMAQRFLREIEVQANIRHQNIMPVFDRGTLPDGRPYFTMELLYKPWTLAEIVQHREQGTLSRYTTLRDLEQIEELIAKVVMPVGDGIYVANIENGVIHRDLKPDNVLIDSRTLRPYLIDFGICHVLEDTGDFGSKSVIPPTADDAGIVGTPRFLAPEQARGNVNRRTDVWGLGALLHYCVTGEPPIAGAAGITRKELKRRIEALEQARQYAADQGDQRKADLCDEKLGRLQDESLRTIEDIFRDARDARYTELPPSTPPALAAVIQKAMSRQHSERYVNARQLCTELENWKKGARVRALTDAGGAAAAVASARRALKDHLVTAVLALLAVGVGFFLGKGLAGETAIGESTRVADSGQDIAHLERDIAKLGRIAAHLTPVEARKLWSEVDTRAQAIADRLAHEPDSAGANAVRRRRTFVHDRIAPPLLQVEVDEGIPISARDLILGEQVELKVGENRLPPGLYEITIGREADVTFPLRVPLVVRKEGDKPAQDAAFQTLALPVALADIPAGQTLVLGGRVRARNIPFARPSSVQVVPPFLMDQTEVRNREYLTFLTEGVGEDWQRHLPERSFVVDPDTNRPKIMAGAEDHPVVGLTPASARAYADWRTKVEGRTCRLPHEEEWVLAAGAALGHALANGAEGFLDDAQFTAPLHRAGAHPKDQSPYGIKGLLGNAREMVESTVGQLPGGAVLVKGGGIGDEPDAGAIYAMRRLAGDERHLTTGFRLVREVPRAGTAPPR